GDMKQYEGKDVALTGKIEQSKDQKPQIIIHAADQIKLVDSTTPPAPPTPPAPAPVVMATPTPSTPMPAPPAATPMPSLATSQSSVPAPPPPPPAPVMPAAKQTQITLAPNWSRASQGGEMVRKDLAKLFGDSGSPSDRVEGDPTIEVYPGVPFLTPINT